MNYLSVCSGIEAATVAWDPLGWHAVAYSEIEKFPSAVLNHHYPDTPNWGDMTEYKDWPNADFNVLVGGTPCQSFSVAGLRKGLADPRGNLALVYLGIADNFSPDWVVWENVPGVLSSGDGRDFGSFLGALGKLGYGWAYRVLDAQYFGVAQRRRRVFVVGYLGDWRPAHAVLFERESLCGHPAPRRKTGTKVAGTLEARASTGGFDPGAHGAASGYLQPVSIDGGKDVPRHSATGFVAQVAPTLQHNGKAAGSATQQDANTGALVAYTLLGKAQSSHDESLETFVAHTVRGESFDASKDGTGRGTPLAPVIFDWYASQSQSMPVGAICPPLKGTMQPAIAFSAKDRAADATTELPPTPRAGGHDRSHANSGNWMAVAVSLRGREGGATAELGGEVCPAIRTGGGGGDKPHVLAEAAVRRLTPRECERLQGFPDDYTQIPWRGKDAKNCPDGPRYKVIGNSMAVPVMHWIGHRINQVATILEAAR